MSDLFRRARRKLKRLAGMPIYAQTNVFFLHIPKTAGTSILHFVSANYAPEKKFVNKPIKEIDQLASGNGYFYCAHGNWDLTRRAPSGTKLISLFRNPKDRIRSTYYFLHESPAAFQEKHVYELAAKKYDFTDWLKFCVDAEGHKAMPAVNSADNLYLRVLLGKQVPPRTPRVDLSETPYLLEVAKDRIDTLDACGLVERFDETLNLFCKTLQISDPILREARKVNVTKSTPKQINFDDQTTDLLNALTQYDAQLYAHAKTVFARQTDALQTR